MRKREAPFIGGPRRTNFQGAMQGNAMCRFLHMAHVTLASLPAGQVAGCGDWAFRIDHSIYSVSARISLFAGEWVEARRELILPLGGGITVFRAREP